MAQKNCPVCKSKELSLFDSVDFNKNCEGESVIFKPTDIMVEYYICNNCSSVLPVTDIKKEPVNIFFYYFCCCFK